MLPPWRGTWARARPGGRAAPALATRWPGQGAWRARLPGQGASAVARPWRARGCNLQRVGTRPFHRGCATHRECAALVARRSLTVVWPWCTAARAHGHTRPWRRAARAWGRVSQWRRVRARGPSIARGPAAPSLNSARGHMARRPVPVAGTGTMAPASPRAGTPLGGGACPRPWRCCHSA